MYRLPLVLCELEGRSRQQAARELTIPEGTLSSRLARARRLLSKRLTRRGLTLAMAPLLALVAKQSADAAPPAGLIHSTVRFATASAAGSATLVSANVQFLAEGVLKAMLAKKLGMASLCVLLIGFIGAGTIVMARGALQSGQASGHRLGFADSPADARVPRPETRSAAAVPAPQSRPPSFTLDRFTFLLEELLSSKRSDEQIVEALYLAALVRSPSEREAKASIDYVANAKDRQAAYLELLKALTTSPEFETLHEINRGQRRFDPRVPVPTTRPATATAATKTKVVPDTRPAKP
jgi:hypothetical protein